MSELEHQSTVLKEAIRDFRRSVEITRDVRFQANLRLAGRQRGSAYIVSTLSLFVIALSLIPNILNLEAYQSQILLACSVVLSVFVIFTSLIDGAQNFYHQGELLHQCARRIAVVHHELKTVDMSADLSEVKAELRRLQEEYQAALDECPINHENVDFYKEIAAKPHLFPDQYSGRCKAWTRLRYKSLYWTLGKLWMAPHLLAFATISVIVYFTILLHPVPHNPSPAPNVSSGSALPVQR